MNEGYNMTRTTRVKSHTRRMKLHDFKLAGLKRENAKRKNLSVKFYGNKRISQAWDKELELENAGISFDAGGMVVGAPYREWNIDWSFQGTPTQRKKVLAWAKAHGARITVEKVND